VVPGIGGVKPQVLIEKLVKKNMDSGVFKKAEVSDCNSLSNSV